ncbi:MAG: hypothetical protein ACI865_001906 [Flavobacteriaceae bacterium]|jgi:hypothetical protein
MKKAIITNLMKLSFLVGFAFILSSLTMTNENEAAPNSGCVTHDVTKKNFHNDAQWWSVELVNKCDQAIEVTIGYTNYEGERKTATPTVQGHSTRNVRYTSASDSFSGWGEKND